MNHHLNFRGGFLLSSKLVSVKNGLSIFTPTMKKLQTIFFLFLSLAAFGQSDPMAQNAFLERGTLDAFDYWQISKPNLTFHSSFKPYLSSSFADANDSAIPFKFYPFKNFFLSKTLNEKPQIKNWVNLQVHPILDQETGYDGLLKKSIVSVIGGAQLKLNINNDFTLVGSVFGGKITLPFFLDTSISSQKILPAFGQAYGTPKNGYTFFDFRGYMSYSPHNNKIFNFQLGRDKHFIGDGYRSLLLSDFGPAYPYFRINTNIWRLQYNVWYTWMFDVTNANGFKSKYSNKFATFHYLSYNITKQLNIGFFENIVWRGTDSNQVRTFEVNYLNPIIFLRPQEYAVGSPDNSFIGLNFNLTLFKKIKLYGQVALDEFYLKEIRARRGWWANKQGLQLGAKYINAFGIKGLKLQAEFNQVRPYTYSHGIVQQNYAHYGSALAHPFGANFKELLGFINYRHNKWELALQGMYAIIGKDSSNLKSNVGQNIFLSYNTRPFEYGHFTTQGIKTTVIQTQAKLSYLLLPNLNLRVELGYVQRFEKNPIGYELKNPYLFFGIKTSFWNSYNDF